MPINLIVTVHLKTYSKPVVTKVEDEDSIIGPLFLGSKRDIHRFRIMDVPGFQFKESAVNYLVNSLAAQNANPGSYPVAFNIPYQRLKSRGVVSENKGLTIEEAAESLGRKVSTLRLAYKEGKLAVSWVPRFRPYGGPRPAAIDPLDLQIYVERRDSKKDLIKGQ